VATREITVSDLCLKAAEKLMEELNWEKNSLDLLSLVTQNIDYINHPTSFVVHDKMGLSEDTMCVDFHHGCPGWVVALSSVCSMISSGNIKRALLLDGDTVSKDQDASNREERPLFGDAGTATALEYCPGAPSLYFNIGTKSDEGMALARLHGGYRNPYTIETLKDELDRLAGRLPQDKVDSKMDSMDVFSFAITKVPKAMKKLCSEFGINIEDVDQLVLHQANKMIVEAIAKRMKVSMEKVPMCLKNYGNTTSASIPLAIVSEAAESYKLGHQRSMVCGFGTGLAWGAAYFETDNLVCPKVVVY
jgi:3-oxoacyl-[acyl-carrier-protein] synthase-3